MAGVGKTALALHVAHRLSDRFPDGQLYVDLRGFDPSQPPLSRSVLRGFLCGLGVMPQHIPGTRRARPRSTAVFWPAGVCSSSSTTRWTPTRSDRCSPARRTASSWSPAATSCWDWWRTRVLARWTWASWTRRTHGRCWPIGSAPRLAAEPQTVRDITALCGRLPLALAVVAARLATHRGFTMTSVAQHMRETGPLSGFVGPDSALDIRNVFSWSCRNLSPRAARLFRLLALRPGPDITVQAAAALADMTVTATGRSLAELGQTHLVIEHVPGRFTLHDLLQAYALELMEAETSETEQRAVLGRVLDHYVLLARAAAAVLDPESMSESTVFPDAESALGWFSAERGVLTEAIRGAAEAGLHEHAWRLGHALGGFYELSGLFHEWASVQRMAFDSAQRLADQRAHAHAHRRLGRVTSLLHGYEEAQHHLERARDLYAKLGLPLDLAHAHRTLAWVMAKGGRPQEAVDQAEQALVLYRAHGETIMAGVPLRHRLVLGAAGQERGGRSPRAVGTGVLRRERGADERGPDPGHLGLRPCAPGSVRPGRGTRTESRRTVPFVPGALQRGLRAEPSWGRPFRRGRHGGRSQELAGIPGHHDRTGSAVGQRAAHQAEPTGLIGP
ncbi:tetratricopeptide repeat protein [Streptomyces sp. T1317-0309]|nr:tetratricopeptide repeat protein [Streptomyces sp. T1317-0309]